MSRREHQKLTPWEMLGLKLRSRAMELRLHGAEVARRAGLSAAQYNNYTNGKRKPDPFTLYNISVVLGIPVDELLNPKPLLLERDAATYQALRRFHRACEQLSGDDIHVLADFAEMTAGRRMRGNSAPLARGLSATWQALARVHERLIPVIIRKYAPARLEAEQHRRDDGNLWLFITTDHERTPDAKSLKQALRTLAKELLSLPEDGIDAEILAHTLSQTASISLRVRLGQPPWEQR
jgi:transcriptional regulator with XRE-family HTH domain